MNNEIGHQITHSFNTLFLQLMLLREWKLAHYGRGPEYSKDEVFILELISQYGGIRAHDIAKFFDKHQSQITHSVSKLEEKGLIQRTSTGSDIRAKPLCLTEAGQKILICLRTASSCSILDHMIKGMTDEETAKLEGVLEILGKKLYVEFQEFRKPCIAAFPFG